MSIDPPGAGGLLAMLTTERPRPERIRESERGWYLAVGAVCFGAFMGQLDASIVALAYTPIRHTFHASLGAVQWISLSYLLTLVALLVPIGRMSDRYGRKLIYLYGFFLFTVASAACGFAMSLGALVAFRFAQAAGAAMLQANSVALVTTSAPPHRTRAALGVQAGAQALGLALGPTLGGVLVATIGWRWIFGINVPVGCVALVAGHYLLPRTKQRTESPGFDVRGMLRLAKLTGRPLVGGFCGYLVLFGPLVLVPVMLSDAGSGSVRTGLITGALPAGFALASTTADRVLPAKWSNRRRVIAGLALAFSATAAAIAVPYTAWTLAALLAVLGLGLGVFLPANNAQVMTTVPQRSAGTAGGLVNTARGLGTALGVAAVTSSLHAGASGPRVGFAVLAGFAALALALSS